MNSVVVVLASVLSVAPVAPPVSTEAKVEEQKHQVQIRLFPTITLAQSSANDHEESDSDDEWALPD